MEIAECGLKHVACMKKMEAEHIGDRSFLVTTDQYVENETCARLLFQTAYEVADRAGRVAMAESGATNRDGDAACDEVMEAVNDWLEGKIPDGFNW